MTATSSLTALYRSSLASYKIANQTGTSSTSSTSTSGTSTSGTSTTGSSTSSTTTSTSTSSTSPTSRSANAVSSAFSATIADGTRTESGISSLLSGELESIFGALNKNGDIDSLLSTALDSLDDLIQTALDDDEVTGIQIRIANVSQQLTAEDGSGSVFSSISQLSIEVGLVRGDKVESEDVSLIAFDGKSIDLTDAQKQTGIVNGIYRVTDGDSGNEAQDTATQQALDRLKQVSQALADFRNGDSDALDQIENLFRGGTLDAEGIRALSEANDVTQSKVFPGSGIIDL